MASLFPGFEEVQLVAGGQDRSDRHRFRHSFQQATAEMLGFPAYVRC